MARQAIVLSICCVASLGSSRDCAAQIFGTLSPREGRSLADDVQDPTMAKWPKWLMTLPQHHLSEPISTRTFGRRSATQRAVVSSRSHWRRDLPSPGAG